MDGGKWKSGRKKKVFPDDTDGIMNAGYEMDSVEEKDNNKQLLNKFKAVAKAQGVNQINMISNIKAGASRWRKYVSSRRKSKEPGVPDHDRRKHGGYGLHYELSDATFDVMDGSSNSTALQNVVAQNRNLIEYFAKLGQTKSADENINLDYVELLLKNGARIDCTDKYGQTVLHEAARAWHVDVARFLIEQNASKDLGDNYGRTALHIAAAVDYPEMINYLVRAGADKEAQTKGEQQTPVHFAARNDACASLRALIKAGCAYKDVRDYKGRTPLHLAAELDRSETARLLLELDDPAPAGVEDYSGQAAIVWMITKMPPVARIAMDQFHTKDRANRRQYYYLNHLDPRKSDDDRPVYPQAAIKVIVDYKQFDLVTHPVVMKNIDIKWQKFGMIGALMQTGLNVLFILLWTLQGILIEYDKRYDYDLPSQWWRIMLFILAILSTAWQVKDELSEFFHSKKSFQKWRDWRQNEIERDIEYSHPRWAEEEQYLQQEIDELDDMTPQYFNDFWNIFDWICYLLLLTVILTHIVDVFNHNETVARLHIRIFAATIILIWLRLMKNARAFSTLGPFIVMISHMMSDVARFGFLYLEFYIPYVCAFWMLYGGDKIPEEYKGLPNAENYTTTINGMAKPEDMMFTLFRMTLVDEYPYDDMLAVDSSMTGLMVGTWLALSAIVMLNLLIALMSDTFQRVYDNAKANAVMQKAITILSIEESLSAKRRRKFRDYIHGSCSPLKDFYDDDATDVGGDDLKKVTFQIKDAVEELKESLQPQKKRQRRGRMRRGQMAEDQLAELQESLEDESRDRKGGNTSGRLHHDSIISGSVIGTESVPVAMDQLGAEMDGLREEIRSLKDSQQELTHRVRKDMHSMKTLLKILVATKTGADGGRSAPQWAQSSSVRVEDWYSSFSNSTQSSTQKANDPMWEKVEKRRKHDLRKLRSDLEKQQKRASQEIPKYDSLSSDEFDVLEPKPTVEVSNAPQSGSQKVTGVTPSSADC